MDGLLYFQSSSMETLFPKALWLTLMFTMLLTLIPTPLQHFLLPILGRGKIGSPSSLPPILTVPHGFFLHFYILGAVFNGAILLLVLAHIYVEKVLLFGISIEEAWRIVFILSLFELQVLRRLYESLYLSKFSPDAQMHILAYILGLIYYVIAPLSLFPSGVGRTITNTYIAYRHGYTNIKLNDQGQGSLLFLDWSCWIGAAIFMFGWIHQHRCHSILASLRAKGAAKNVSYEYKVPFGDWFEYVSSAHYLAEFVMYFGFIVLTGGRNLDTWLLFAFVVLNLSIAAGHTHKWYKRKFENYPKSRKAIIPFIY